MPPELVETENQYPLTQNPNHFLFSPEAEIQEVTKRIVSQSKICIVDDVSENIKLLRTILKNEGYKICIAKSGKQALEVIPKNASMKEGLHLILLDIMMEEMDSGYKVCQELKSNPLTRNIPIIFISAKNDTNDIVRGLELGAEDYITKPFNEKEVFARVERNLGNYHRELMLYKLMGLLRISNFDTIERLNRAAEYRDNETGNHVKRMSFASKLLAQKIGLSDQEAENIYFASGMHDIGKIGIPDHILLKPGKLDPEEWEVMKTHTINGGNILSGSKSPVLELGRVVALTHQEKFDGSGYPNQLVGNEIPLVGRIVAICDVFDALISERPYKEAWGVEKAKEYIVTQKGIHFDPVLVDKFIEIIPEILEHNKMFQDS